MSTEAYVLIQTEIGQAAGVADRVREIPGVVEANGVIGSYDVIARAVADSTDELGRLVASRIQSIEGITRTLTCPVVDLGSATPH
jgi:DNA-binding Lrp family transcriptional regulator